MPDKPLTVLHVPLAGQIAFREFLKSEYSEENILFWLACEEYKKIKTVPEMISSANRIYSEFVQTEAPKQVGSLQKGLDKGLDCYHLNLVDEKLCVYDFWLR